MPLPLEYAWQLESCLPRSTLSIPRALDSKGDVRMHIEQLESRHQQADLASTVAKSSFEEYLLGYRKPSSEFVHPHAQPLGSEVKRCEQ